MEPVVGFDLKRPVFRVKLTHRLALLKLTPPLPDSARAGPVGVRFGVRELLSRFDVLSILLGAYLDAKELRRFSILIQLVKRKDATSARYRLALIRPRI